MAINSDTAYGNQGFVLGEFILKTNALSANYTVLHSTYDREHTVNMSLICRRLLYFNHNGVLLVQTVNK